MNRHHSELLAELAREAMVERGLLPDFSHEIMQEVARLEEKTTDDGASIRDMRKLLW
jgi:hypothetical protein